MKTCRLCGQTKPLDEFHRHPGSPDGRQYRCKSCAIAAARQWAKDHPEKRRENMRKYAQGEKHRATVARHRERNRDAINAKKRETYQRNRDEINARNRERRQRLREGPEYLAERRERYERWRQRDPRGVHRHSIWANYGLTLDQFDAMVLAQEGRCAVCSDPMPDPHVDHCHATGKVRALLCHLCNRGLGLFREDPERLAAAITYLRAHSPG